MPKFPNSIDAEISKFDLVANIWWDPDGEMGSLHAINPLRMQFITEGMHVDGARILDVGCGGGILSEALARAGAQVTGIDLSEASLEAARKHAESQGLQIDYRLETLEQVSRNQAGEFDAVTCMEMLEHVPEPEMIVAGCALALKPGGHFFCSSINRTPKAWLFAILGGEYILHLLPRGSHSYHQLIRPVEIKRWADKNELKFEKLSSLNYNILTRKFHRTDGKADVNYLLYFMKSSLMEKGK